MSATTGNESIFEIVGTLLKNYSTETPTRVKLLDLFTVYSLLTAVVLFVYVAMVGTFPFNSFLAAFITAIGAATLTSTCVVLARNFFIVNLIFDLIIIYFNL